MTKSVIGQSYVYGDLAKYTENFSRQFSRITEDETDPERPLSLAFIHKACDNINNYFMRCANMKILSEAYSTESVNIAVLEGWSGKARLFGMSPVIVKPSYFRKFRMWISGNAGTTENTALSIHIILANRILKKIDDSLPILGQTMLWNDGSETIEAIWNPGIKGKDYVVVTATAAAGEGDNFLITESEAIPGWEEFYIYVAYSDTGSTEGEAYTLYSLQAQLYLI